MDHALLSMMSCRIYGKEPYKVALIHGGPGAAGSLKECAEVLASYCGILEPIQTADSIEGQIEELKQILEQYAQLPVTLIGHSWGAMLGYLFTARHPKYVKKLIIVGSGVFDVKYVNDIYATRINRLPQEKQLFLQQLMTQLENNPPNADKLFFNYGKLTEEVDAFDPIKFTDNEARSGQYLIYKKVWPELEKIRRTGELLTIGKNIHCPVIAIHGDFDSHAYRGVQEPLTTALEDFTFILLKKCGHEPWIERHARDQFFEHLKSHL